MAVCEVCKGIITAKDKQYTLVMPPQEPGSIIRAFCGLRCLEQWAERYRRAGPVAQSIDSKRGDE